MNANDTYILFADIAKWGNWGIKFLQSKTVGSTVHGTGTSANDQSHIPDILWWFQKFLATAGLMLQAADIGVACFTY